MLDGRSVRTTGSSETDDERARILARLESLTQERSSDTTRKIGTDSDDRPAAYDGSLAHHHDTGTPALYSSLETRAYLMTADGGVLAELPCTPSDAPVVIGRGKTADIRVDDPYVHRHQAEISWDSERGAHVIAHGGGENGTYVNRHRVRLPLRLVGGERLRFGKTTLVYRIRR